MTNEEASKIIKAYKHRLENSCSNKLDEDIDAFDLAINALEEERSKGDLISREALKEALSKRLWFVSSPECDAQEIKDIIDNAPTVEPNISETYRVGYEQGFRHGKEKYERPQGEWIFKKFDEETGISNSDWCPFCGKAKAQVYDNFCGNCGAELRGDKNESY